VLGSAVAVSKEVRVSMLVRIHGVTVCIVIDWKMLALFVTVPRLKVTSPALVDQLPTEDEIERTGTLVGSCTKFVTPVKVVRPLLLI